MHVIMEKYEKLSLKYPCYPFFLLYDTVLEYTVPVFRAFVIASQRFPDH